jgi:hypothetical protein
MGNIGPLAWDVASGATGYKIHYGASSGVYTTTIDVGNVLTYTITGLANGIYYLVVSSYDGGGDSGNSNELIAAVGAANLAVPATAAGTCTVSAVSRALVKSVAAAAGVAVALAVSAIVGPSVGHVAGTSTAFALSADFVAVASAAGTSTAAGISAKLTASVASAAGTSTASASTGAVGQAAGTSSAVAFPVPLNQGVGACTGFAAVVGFSPRTQIEEISLADLLALFPVTDFLPMSVNEYKKSERVPRNEDIQTLINALLGSVGSFQCTPTASTTVANTLISLGARIFIMPTNAAAATLMQSTKSLYVSAVTHETGFTVTTADGTAAAGNETFSYWFSNP